MTPTNGKGSRQRPTDSKAYADNFERIFGHGLRVVQQDADTDEAVDSQEARTGLDGRQPASKCDPA